MDDFLSAVAGMIEFTVADWAAWAPGLTGADDWRAWARQPYLPQGDDTPQLTEVPAMQRRRIERLGRMAMQAAYWCQPVQTGATPLVFASRHGDPTRSLELLDAMTRGEAMSPAGFSLSVHNAIAALYSIVRGERGNYVALAAGAATAEAALVEAAGLLADGAPEALVVVYDAPLPGVYRPYADEPDPYYAWCWRIAGEGEGPRIALANAAAERDIVAAPPALPHGLDVLRFLLAGDGELAFRNGNVQWRWSRRA